MSRLKKRGWPPAIESTEPTFYQWLLNRYTIAGSRYRNTPSGILAATIAADPSFTKENGLKQIRAYLTDAAPDTLDTFNRAWGNYRRWLRKNTGISFEG